MRASSYPLVDAAEASATVLEHTPVLGVERVGIVACGGRVLAADLMAPFAMPTDPVSAVDGYAVRAADAGRTIRIIGESAAGKLFDGTVDAGVAVRILTGGVVPDGADCVAMLEEVSLDGELVTMPPTLRSGSNVHRPGDDLRAGDLLVGKGTRLGPAELGLAAAVGCAELDVHKRPRVALMSTGNELIEVGGILERGKIFDSNRWALLAALNEAGADVTLLANAPDEAELLRGLVTHALRDADVLVTSGGVSVGTHDLIKPLLESLGEVHIGRVKLKPGKPFTFATLPAGKVAFGLPGFPVSSLVTFEVFVRPALLKMQGSTQVARPTLPVRLGFDASPNPDRTEYHRVTLRRDGSELAATSTGSQSSSRLLSLAGAHALVRVPPGGQGIKKGTVVEALILSLP